MPGGAGNCCFSANKSPTGQARYCGEPLTPELLFQQLPVAVTISVGTILGPRSAFENGQTKLQHTPGGGVGQGASFFFSSSLTWAGLALPWVAFIT